MCATDLSASPLSAAAAGQGGAPNEAGSTELKHSTWHELMSVFVWTLPVLLRDLLFLTIYVILLLPGFLPMAWFYFTTPDRISVRYKNDSCRNTLDVYGSSLSHHRSVGGTNQQQQQEQKQKPPLKPVILFLPGGAFTIGYKLWAALLAQALVPAGLVIVVADYRNYPWGTVPDMLHDADAVLRWTIQHCQRFGGNPEQVLLVGQSAGAHLGLMTLLRRYEQQEHATTSIAQRRLPIDVPDQQQQQRQLPNVKGFIGLSGVYDMQQVIQLCAKHGLSSTFVTERLLGNRRQDCDPTEWLLRQKKLAPSTRTLSSLPPIELWHGTADRTVRGHRV